MNGLTKYLIVVMFLVLTAAMGTVAYMLAEPAVSPIKYTAWCLKNAQMLCATEFRAGEMFYIHREFIVTRNASFQVVRSIVNEDKNVTLFRSTPVNTYWPKGNASRTLAHIVPEYAAPGNYSFRTELTYPVNQLQREAMAESPPMYFKVIK